MIEYGFVKELTTSFDDVCNALPEVLKVEGFGILTRINVHEKFKEKLDVDFEKYVIFGVCHPPSVYKALLLEDNIGLMLPCNILVYEKEGKTVLSVIRPTIAMAMIPNEGLEEIAEEVEDKLENIFEAIE